MGMKRSLTLVACFLSFHTVSAADLVAVYQRALQNDPQLREAEANRLAALESKPQALAALLPQISGSALASKERDTGPSNQQFSFTDVSSGTPIVIVENQDFNGRTITHSHKFGVDLKQNIFRWENWVALQRADAQVAQAEADYQAAQQDLISRVAQRYFDQGLLFVYGYYFPEALASFQEAARLDPQCAMIQWGIALATAPNPNSRYGKFPDDPKEQGREAIQKAWSLRTGASENERTFIAALLVRYDREKYPDRSQRDAAYAQAMKELVQRYPDDPEAGTFYADALMTLSPWNYWMPDGQPRPGTLEVVSALEHVMAIRPDHPGANHLYVHLFENSQNPARALPAADRLDFLARRQRQHQPRALQLLQRLLLRAADHRLFVDVVEGHRAERPGDERVRLESRDHGSGQADECDRGARRS